jgi:hypothetical protein
MKMVALDFRNRADAQVRHPKAEATRWDADLLPSPAACLPVHRVGRLAGMDGVIVREVAVEGVIFWLGKQEQQSSRGGLRVSGRAGLNGKGGVAANLRGSRHP